MPGPVAIGAALPTKRDRTGDQPRVHRTQIRMPQTKACQHAGSVIFDHRIDLFGQPQDHVARIPMTDIKLKRPFVPRQHILRADPFAGRIIQPIPTKDPRLFAQLARVFDPRDLGPHFRQHPGAIGPRQKPRKIQDTQAF